MSEAGTGIGRPIDRVDGALKVTGRAQFAAEFAPSGLAYAVVVQSSVPSGRFRVDTSEARRRPGVLAVLTYENALALPQKGRAAINPPAGRTLPLLQDDAIHYYGAPLRGGVAQTFRQHLD